MRNISALIFALVAVICRVDGQRGEDSSQGFYQQCQDKKTVCVGLPSDCYSGSSPSCMMMATIQLNGDKSKLMFKLVGTSIPRTESYVALGIAEDGHGMRDASIISCTNTGDMAVYWSAEATRPTLVGEAKYFKGVENPRTPGKIICKFELDSQFSESNVEFDLADKNYAILLASGDYQGGELQRHADNKRQLFGPMSLSTPSSATSPNQHYLVLYLWMVVSVVAFAEVNVC